MFTDRSIQVKPVGPRAPNLNAFVERWIQSLKHGALDHFMVIGLDHFDYIVREYATYYHEHRPHQGIGNTTIAQLESVDGPQHVPPSRSHLASDLLIGNHAARSTHNRSLHRSIHQQI